MAIERIDRQSGLSQPRVLDTAVGARAQAEALGTIIRVVDNIGDDLFRRAAKRAEIQGGQAGTRDAVQFDENGNLKPLTKLPPAHTIYGSAYRAAAMANYQHALETDAAVRADQLQNEFDGDPEGFREAWNLYTETTLGELEPTVADTVVPSLYRIGATRFTELADRQAEREMEQARTNSANRIEEKLRAAGHMADELRLSEQGVVRIGQILHEEVLPLLRQRMEFDPDYGEADLTEDMRKAHLRLLRPAIVSEAWAIASENMVDADGDGVPEPDMDAARQWLLDLETNAPEELALLASPEEIAEIAAGARTGLELKAAAAAQERARQSEGIAFARIQRMDVFTDRIARATTARELDELLVDIEATTITPDRVQNVEDKMALKAKIRDRLRAITAGPSETELQANADWIEANERGIPLKPTTRGRRAADYGWNIWKQIGRNTDLHTDEGRETAAAFARRYKVWPEDVEEELMGVLNSTDPEHAAHIAAMYSSVAAESPSLQTYLSGQHGQRGAKAAEMLRRLHLASLTGGEPVEALATVRVEMDKLYSPEGQGQRVKDARELVSDPERMAAVRDEARRVLIENTDFSLGDQVLALFGLNDAERFERELTVRGIPQELRGGPLDALFEVRFGVDRAADIPPIPERLWPLFDFAYERALPNFPGNPEGALNAALREFANTVGVTLVGPNGAPEWVRNPIEVQTGLPSDMVRTRMLEQALDYYATTPAAATPGYTSESAVRERIADGRMHIAWFDDIDNWAIVDTSENGALLRIPVDPAVWSPEYRTAEERALELELATRTEEALGFLPPEIKNLGVKLQTLQRKALQKLWELGPDKTVEWVLNQFELADTPPSAGILGGDKAAPAEGDPPIQVPAGERPAVSPLLGDAGAAPKRMSRKEADKWARRLEGASNEELATLEAQLDNEALRKLVADEIARRGGD